MRQRQQGLHTRGAAGRRIRRSGTLAGQHRQARGIKDRQQGLSSLR